MELIMVLIIAITLSMDAFSLSLIYGTLNIPMTKIVKLSIIVGMYHFFMPLIGLTLGNIIQKYISIEINLIVFAVFLIIGIQMIMETQNTKEEIKGTNIFEMFLFGLAVSIDSFSVGIGLNAITTKTFLCPLVFSIVSSVFTYIGLCLGKRLNILIGKLSTLIGGIILIVLAFIYLFKFI